MLNMKNPFIFGKKVYLRAPEAGDEQCAALCENHPDPRETLFYPLPTSFEQQRTKINKWVEDQATVLFTICTIAENTPIGMTAFVRIDWIGRMATFYIAIGEKENWSQGYGTEVVNLMVRYGFETLNLNRIQLHVVKSNEKAIKAYKKAGYVIEGTLEQAMYFNNTYHDFYIMAILKQNWNSL
ncbi:MAG: GNAT family N-acetyltransferase [Deferribacteres bacterium]|nr:GNAT family N-acetyltransferase [candidate division KSB1 bacterium]MCB9501462.1 GNAT family N-acetyltransferase [Deferribacteres bacterium]